MTVPRSPRAHDAVLGQPILEALLAEVVRAKQEFEAMADGVEGAMAHEGRTQQRAKNQIVAERVEALGILERGSLRRSLHSGFVLEQVTISEGPELEGVLLLDIANTSKNTASTRLKRA